MKFITLLKWPSDNNSPIWKLPPNPIKILKMNPSKIDGPHLTGNKQTAPKRLHPQNRLQQCNLTQHQPSRLRNLKKLAQNGESSMCYPSRNLFKSSHLKTSLFLHMSPLLIFGTRSAYTTISSISSLKFI